MVAGERGWSFGTLLGPGITGPDSVSGWVVVRFFLDCPAHGLSRTSRTLGGVCGGGCDGVVVWELYSGREHLVRQVKNRWPSGRCFCLVLHSNFL